MTEFNRGALVTIVGDNKRANYKVEAGPFKAVYGDREMPMYVVRRPDGSHRWVSGERLERFKIRPEGYRKGDRAKVGSKGLLGMGTLDSGPFRQADGVNTWVVLMDNPGNHLLVPEKLLDVQERPGEPGDTEGHVTIGNKVYAVGPRYRDRYGDLWNTGVVNGMARAVPDGFRVRAFSNTLAAVVNAYGPLTQV
ncbi:hypothetical protein [Streptomyces fungicidicus]|uniref:hypothetical protein n=1 Tax=Streptomyces fungicidicus TaxID=68203 RepID=UPI0036AF31E7